MATVMLYGAKTYSFGNLVFALDRPTIVDDKVAEELAALPEYFTVVFDGRKVGACRTPRPEPTAEQVASI